MKKLLKGFTLAEILITLAVIGVVARVTMPALTSNVRAQQTTTTLAKAMNTLEVGNQRILDNTSSTTLMGAGVIREVVDDAETDWSLTPSGYLSLLGNHLNGQYSTMDYVVDGGEVKENLPVFISKDGIAFVDGSSLTGLTEPIPRLNTKLGPYFMGKGQSTVETRRKVPEKYDGNYVKILVDLNGSDNPNKVGKDQFVFYIDNKGSAIPYGGIEYNNYALLSDLTWITGNERTNGDGPVPEDPSWKEVCGSGASPKTLAQRAACTGSIIDNGYKIVYNF